MEGRISQPPERGGEIVIQQASDDCQAVLLHCRCDANIHSSFSSLRCVILLPVLPSAPSSSPFLSSFPLLVSPAVFLPCMPLLTLWAFLFFFLLLFIYLFVYLSGLPHSSFTPSFFSSFHPLSGDEWVEWSIVPWRLLCHPLFRRARLCVHECVYLKSPHTTRKMDIPFYSGLNKRSELLLHRCCPTNI